MNNFLKIGHRGAAGYEPENTLRSFARAIELKCGAVEFDVRLAASGEAVVIHDSTLERTTNGQGKVCAKSLAELKTLDAGKGERIPTLEEALDLIDGKAVANIEIKDDEATGSVINIIDKYVKTRGRHYGDFIVSSFNHLNLWRAKELSPGIITGALIDTLTHGFADFAGELGCCCVNTPAGCVTRQFIDELHGKDIRVFVFTVNDPGEIKQMKAPGVDGIFSDFPDRL